jgi:hypothetical protein
MEVGWLIEKGLLCLGIDAGCSKPVWVTFTNEGAIRFSRKVDAENTLRSFKSFGVAGAFDGCTISEHQMKYSPEFKHADETACTALASPTSSTTGAEQELFNHMRMRHEAQLEITRQEEKIRYWENRIAALKGDPDATKPETDPA